MDNFFVKSVCIDDFALKKRQRYGTIMVDFDSGRIVDMIETRETEAVAAWLSGFPNIRYVSRDGSRSYASAIGRTELIEKKWIVQLLYKPLDKIRALTREQFAAILKEYPLAQTILRACVHSAECRIGEANFRRFLPIPTPRAGGTQGGSGGKRRKFDRQGGVSCYEHRLLKQSIALRAF